MLHQHDPTEGSRAQRLYPLEVIQAGGVLGGRKECFVQDLRCIQKRACARASATKTIATLKEIGNLHLSADSEFAPRSLKISFSRQ